MAADTLSIPLFPSKPLAETLGELITILNIKAPVPENPSDARARIVALQDYLLALRLSCASGDRNAMFDRLTAGIVECRAILNPPTTKRTP